MLFKYKRSLQMFNRKNSEKIKIFFFNNQKNKIAILTIAVLHIYKTFIIIV